MNQSLELTSGGNFFGLATGVSGGSVDSTGLARVATLSDEGNGNCAVSERLRAEEGAATMSNARADANGASVCEGLRAETGSLAC